MEESNKITSAVKISDVLWKAANNILFVDLSSDKYGYNYNHYSCVAVQHACENFEPFHLEAFNKLLGRCLDFVTGLGISLSSINAFDEFPEGKERQDARYFWLMFAYLVALDEEKEGLL
jgi:hypothetical protein